MKQIIEFTVPAVPIAQPRKWNVLNHGVRRTIQAPRVHPIHAFKATVRLAVAAAYRGPPLEGPVELHTYFILPRRKNKFWKAKPMPRILHDRKPDEDNLVKGLKDALNGLAWLDDAQVCRSVVEKWEASGDEQPHVEVAIFTRE